MNEMERLTKRNKDGLAYYPKCFEEPCAGMGCQKNFCENELRYCEKLAAYEDIGTVEEFAELKQAKSDGRLVVLPCKVGDTIYRINANKRDQRYGVHEEQVTAVDVTVYINGIIRPLEYLFPDREAAEAALVEMEGE